MARALSINELPADVQAEVRHRATVGGARVAPIVPAMMGPDSPLHQVANASRSVRVDREHPAQVDVIEWADDPATLALYPELESLYSIPNESGAGGKRSKRQRQLEGARKRAAGQRKGMLDLCLPVPRLSDGDARHRVYGALYVEMKDESTGVVRKEQRDRIALLRRVGNRCEVAMSAASAKAIIVYYLSLPRP